MKEVFDKKRVLDEISRVGYIILDTNESEEKRIRERHFELVSQIGIPAEHNLGKQDYFWRVTPKTSKSKIQTFSEHSNKADLHTDSQYRINPEKYFSLSSIKEAKCGGGRSLLLDSQNVLIKLEKENRELFNELKLAFPIAVPDIFNLNDKTFIEAPLIENENNIRFRYDTIKKGLEDNGYSQDSKKWKAFKHLTQIIHNSQKIKSLILKTGQIMIIDNYRMLHGRTEFSDPNRLMYRIRFN